MPRNVWLGRGQTKLGFYKATGKKSTCDRSGFEFLDGADAFRNDVMMNLLFLTTDQQRFDTIQCLGAKHMLTPHLNWLVESGIHFRRGYSESPVCVTARAAMLTGRHFHKVKGTGWWGQPTTDRHGKTMPALLTRAGYQTHGYGKFHYHPPHCNYGWEHIETLDFYYRELRMQRPDRLRAMDHGVGQNEMQQHGHEFANNGDLISTRQKPTRADCRKRTWPGWHSADHTTDDVLH